VKESVLDFAKKQAKDLAAMGYAAFAVDMYGEGNKTIDPKIAVKMAGEVRGTPHKDFFYLAIFTAIAATCRPWNLAPRSSFSEGMRSPFPPVIVDAPYGLQPVISSMRICP